jgi:hypothetical protein
MVVHSGGVNKGTIGAALTDEEGKKGTLRWCCTAPGEEGVVARDP